MNYAGVEIKNNMKPYYIFSPGRIKREENTILFEGKEGKRFIPVEDIEEIHIFGEVDLNTKFLNFIAQKGIPIHIYNYYGFYSGSYLPKNKKVSGLLIVKQVEHYLNYEKRIYLAKCFVESAMYHMERNLEKNGVKDISSEIEDLRKKIDEAKNIQEIMSLEGNARAKYYKIFERRFGERFEKRTKRPPHNPINALISFGNSLLYSTTLSEIYRTPLNPTISYLHEPSEKRFSLSLDISEIFKPIIVDKVIFSLLPHLSEQHFDESVEYVYLSEEGRKEFVKRFDNILSETIRHRTLKRNVSFRRLIRLELYKLIKHLVGDEIYKPLRSWW